MAERLEDDSPHQPESTYNTGEEFEKVDKLEPEQDEEVTTTSFTGEEAEEDRYAAGASQTVATDDLLSLDADSTPPGSRSSLTPDLPPIISDPPPGPLDLPPPAYYSNDFSTTPLPTAHEADTTSVKTEPIAEMESSEVAKPPEVLVKVFGKLQEWLGSWMKNIDPRAEQTEAIHDKKLKRVTPQVEELFVNLKDVSLEREMSYLLYLIYWRDVKKTGVVFGSMMFVFLSLLFFSVLSVLAYLSLAILTVTLSFRVYKNVLQAVQKTGNGHPFKQYLEMDIELPDDKVQKAVEAVLKHVNCTLKELRRLFLIEDIIDSVKFGLLLWMLTYVGSWFNGMTLVILGVVSIFTLPKIYETYKVQIDSYINMVRTQLCKIMGQIMAKLPFLKKKVKSQ